MIGNLSSVSGHLLTALVVAVLIVAAHQIRLGRLQTLVDELPHQLERAALLYSERLLVIDRPFELFGRVDQVWAREGGQLIVADTKIREVIRYYDSDRLQLTGYAFLLKYHPDTRARSIASYGFLRIPQGRKAIYIKVPLLSERAYRDHLLHHRALTLGTARPRSAASPLICKGCGHVSRCPIPLINPQ